MYDFGRIISALTPKQQRIVTNYTGDYQKYATCFVWAAISRPMKNGEKSSYIKK